MRKQTYIRPTFTIVHFQPPLLETISGRDLDIGGDDERPNAAKPAFILYDVFEDEEDDELFE